MDDRMNFTRCLAILSLAAVSCGGDTSMASKSAAAYQEAKAKGLPMGGGHDHAGHEVAADSPSAPSPTDHSVHATMDHSAQPTMDHSAHATMDHSGHATMDHSAHGTMDHSAHATMDHAAHATMDHSALATTDHSAHAATVPAAATSPSGDPHAAHRPSPVTGAAPPSPVDLTKLKPSSTLRPDPFDAPAPKSLSEAAKAQAGGHSGHHQE
jgi:hypothetical protein